MNNRPIMVVMVIRPGPLRSSIKALLNAMSQIGIVAEAKELSTLLNLESDIGPDLILLEADVSEKDLGEVVRQIRATWVGTQTVMLADCEEQRQAAVTAGADAVILKGLRAARFAAVIEKLLADGQLLNDGVEQCRCNR